MAKRTHKDVEFHVETDGMDPKHFDRFDDAAGFAVEVALRNGAQVLIDVVIWSRAGAKWFGGDDAVEQYDDDPEASVFERIVVQADSQGGIP